MGAQLYIATNGLGIWYSDDLGENLIRMNSRMGMYSGNHIWALATIRPTPISCWSAPMAECFASIARRSN